MSYLINRNPPARLQCLHSLCKFINAKFGLDSDFRMNDVKFNPAELNIHSCCDLLTENTSLRIKYCPYKENPLNISGCSLTNGVEDDTTKSKEVSNTINALHALGFVTRTGNIIRLTLEGKVFSLLNFDSPEMLQVIRKAVLRYGPFVGFLYQIFQLDKKEFDTDELNVGYPSAIEQIEYKGEVVTISSGSEGDSNTRTKSCLLAWATTCGFICPVSHIGSYKEQIPHVSSSQYILQTNRNLRKYRIMFLPLELSSGSICTEKPLDYRNLTKNIGALRENNQEKIRELTLLLEPKIQNRRFAISYLLNRAYNESENLSLEGLMKFMLKNEEEFVIQKENLLDVICNEITIAFMVGIPFEFVTSDLIKPKASLNIDELSINAPISIINKLNLYKFNG